MSVKDERSVAERWKSR